jgi:excinuclease UvrABC nuclease subunit
VYILYFKNREKYIGSSGMLKNRLSNHFCKYGKLINTVRIYICKSRKDYIKLEKIFINEFKPKMNSILSGHSKEICLELMGK